MVVRLNELTEDFMRHLAPLLIALLFVSLATTLDAESSTGADSRVVTPPGPGLDLPFSPGILSDDFLFLSGAIANKPGTKIVEGDTAEQMRGTMENLNQVLKAAGLDFSRVVASSVFLADIRHFQTMNEVYGGYFDDKHPPTRTTIEADIAIPNALTEIGMIAARPHVKLEWIVPEGWGTSASYAWGIQAGDTLFLSGMVSSDPKTGQLVTGDFAKQAQQTLDNIGGVLAAAGMSPKNVATCGVYLTDARDYNAMNEVYGRFFPQAAPARATVRARLANPALKIEISCIAVRGERKVIRAAGTQPSPRPLSPAIEAGDRLYLSGMVGRRDGAYPEGIKNQARVTFERLRSTLQAAGMSFRDVESVTVFLTDVRHYQQMNEIYKEIMPSPPPARATVGTQLMSPDALIEIQMVASKK